MAVVWLTRRPSSRNSTKVSSRVFLTSALDQRGHPVHGPVELYLLPAGRTGLPMEHFRGSVGILVQLVDRGALGTEAALAVRAAQVALDVHDLAVNGVDDCGAADRAVGTDAGRGLGVLDTELLGPGGDRRKAGAQPDEGPQRGPRAEAGSGGPEEFTSRKLGHFVRGHQGVR
jgi:hypothetical protein